MREGYTTGSCAAAAAYACALWKTSGKCPEYISIDTPCGKVLCLEIQQLDNMRCGVIKDSGDDPDITNGCMVEADVDIYDFSGDILFRGGEGIGIVTREGLKIPVGEPAINPVPRKMIEHELRKIIGEKSACVTLSVKNGRELAEKTFNGRLGIENGISILGTTGIVRPMSEEAIKDSLLLELQMYINQGRSSIAFTAGNEGEKYLKKEFPYGGCIVQCSNYIGFMLDNAEALGAENILIYGQTGKFVKLAGDIMNTHSHVADGRNEIICTHAALAGASCEIIHELYECVTTDASMKILEKYNLGYVWKNIVEKAAEKCLKRVHGNARVAVAFIDRRGNIIAETDNFRKIAEEWCRDE